MDSKVRKQRGEQAESSAATFLQKKGLALIARNFHCRAGEIDLIMRDQQVLVFVEVRYRSSEQFGGGAASVTPAKQRRLIRAAERYLQQYRLGHLVCRFDVVTAAPGSTPSEPFNLAWIRNAFDAA